MSTLSLRRFSSVELLKSIEPEALKQLLGRYAEYFSGRGIELPASNGSELDYQEITRVLVSPDASTPSALVDDLYYVDEMATKEGMDSLLAGVSDHALSVDVGDEPTPADVAVKVRLLAPDLLERKHAECFLMLKRRSFEYFQSKAGAVRRFVPPRDVAIREFETELGRRLDAMKRGQGCRLVVSHRPDAAWFLVLHGDPRRREGTYEGVAGSVHYRPEKYDIIRYDEERGELAINAEGNKKLMAHYAELFGELLFGDRARFSPAKKFTLEPLQRDGEDSVVCADIEGIESIALKEVKFFWGGQYGETETRSAKDLFAALRDRDGSLPARARIVKASFLVRFANAKNARTVTINQGNKATFTRDDDAALVERWLLLRGFVQVEEHPSPGREAQHERADVAVARP